MYELFVRANETVRYIRVSVYRNNSLYPCMRIDERSVTSRDHGIKISASQQSFLTERAICIVKRLKKSMGYTALFLSAIVPCHKSIFSFFFPAIFVGPRFVEIQKFLYHGIET